MVDKSYLRVVLCLSKTKTKTMKETKKQRRTWQAMVTMRTTAMAMVAALVQNKAPA